jgi:glycosyltransferase involved in cell wall biosynthesis
LGDDKFEFCFTGEGWPARSVYYTDDKLNDFYNEIDYLLIPSKIEGGPMPLMESIAAGTPVIAPDVGFVKEFPHISYENSNLNSLSEVLNKLYENKANTTRAIDEFSWENYATKHIAKFLELANVSSVQEQFKSECNNSSNVCIVIHGSEKSSKGGPSRRCLYTKSLIESKHVTNVSYNFENVENSYDLIHVLNCWPVKSAYKTLIEARQRAKSIVFSPILMDLSCVHRYRDFSSISNISDIDEYFNGVLNSYGELNYTSGLDLEYVKICCDLSDEVIALSQKEVKLLIDLGVDERKIHVVKNCVDPDYIKKLPGKVEGPTFKSKFGIENFVLNVGRVESRKNLISLCYALCDIDIKIVSIGSTSEPDYREKIEELFGDKVIFIDHVEDPNLLYSAYQSCVCYAQVSWCEGASLATLEAHANGCPIVIFDRSGESEYYSQSSEVKLVDSFNGIKKAVEEFILSNISTEEQRKKRLNEAKSLINNYMQGTLLAYERAKSSNRPDRYYIDVTSLAHAIISGRPTTGALALEKNLVGAILEIEEVNLVCWVNPKKGWQCIPNNDLSMESLNHIFVGAGTINQATSTVTKSILPRNILSKCRLFYHHLLLSRKLPNSLKIMLKHTALKFNILRQNRTRSNSTKKVISFAPASYSQMIMEPNSYLYCTGNAWMSNESYLDSLNEIVKQLSLKYTSLVYDILPVTHKDYFPKGFGKQFESKLIKLLTSSYRCVGISDYTISQLHTFCKKRGVKGVSLSKLTVSANVENEVKTVKSPQKFVLYVASINSRKNHQFLIDVWEDLISKNRMLADVKLVLVGRSSFEKNNYNSNNVIHFDSLDDQEVSYLYKKCLFTVYPSLAEGYGLPIVESLLHGKPCISTDLPSISDIHNPALIRLPASEYFEWYDAILSLLNNDDVRKSLSEEAVVFSNLVDVKVSAAQFLGK